ncbi:Uncharacterized protein Rs2_16019 [Raphanus sativus]|nr:Uncharacterized protein Rs2_16019 [Raphanus sativus]
MKLMKILSSNWTSKRVHGRIKPILILSKRPGRGETDDEEEETLNQEAEPENTFGDNSRRDESNQSPNTDQDIEEGSWSEELISGLEEKQALSMQSYRNFGSWYEETDSQISDDETRQPSHETDTLGDDLGVPEEEEVEIEAGRNSHHVPEEEKLSYATKTLTGPALAWWEEEKSYLGEFQIQDA